MFFVSYCVIIEYHSIRLISLTSIRPTTSKSTSYIYSNLSGKKNSFGPSILFGRLKLLFPFASNDIAIGLDYPPSPTLLFQCSYCKGL